ncbi:hypothetical protein LJ739_06615 [Aestuariibacter halophilus]|uniref:Uncharacterized protein n=1 Tax=Fluctibacter halophilus TaxID=226011 RepID=A0ABS8G5Y9_9ALTE|nr:hypothetical protein [Aestuariibacter halophilus]MCC2615908.1 hypothetical protein [Aestuariibacter halophilus]
MSEHRLLQCANATMLFSLLAFIASVVLSYRFESQLPLLLVTTLHVSQMLLAGVFKVAYVVRLVTQKQLGLVVR